MKSRVRIGLSLEVVLVILLREYAHVIVTGALKLVSGTGSRSRLARKQSQEM